MKFPWQRNSSYTKYGIYLFSILATLFADLYNSKKYGALLQKPAHFLDGVISFFAPRFITDLGPRAEELQLWPIFWLSAFVGTLWSLIGNGLFALWNGTFCGTTSALSRMIRNAGMVACGADPTVYYYTDDLPNLLIYFPLTPLYIGLSVCIIVVWTSGYEKLQHVVEGSHSPPTPGANSSAALLSSLPFFALLFIPLIFTLRYAFEYAQVPPGTKMFWYLHKAYEKTPDGYIPQYYYAMSGIYYLVSNNIKLLIVVSAILCFLTMSLLVIHFGSNIASYDFVKEGKSDRVTKLLLDYNLTATLIKWLVLVLTLHFLCWFESRNNHGINIKVSAAFLICIGVFFLNTPRYYAEEKFLHYIETNQVEARPKHLDFRADNYQLLQSFIDAITVISALSIALYILFGFDFNIKTILHNDLMIK